MDDSLHSAGIVVRGVGSRIPSRRILAPGSVFGQDTFALSLMGRYVCAWFGILCHKYRPFNSIEKMWRRTADRFE